MYIEDKNNPFHITIAEGDFGLILPIELTPEEGELITEDTNFQINIFKKINTEPLVSKVYSNIENDTIEFELTENESLLLKRGEYVYDLDWYQNGVFMCNILPKQKFSVIEKGKKVGGANES